MTQHVTLITFAILVCGRDNRRHPRFSDTAKPDRIYARH